MGVRPGPMVTARDARRMATTAIRKMRRELVRQGVDATVVRELFRMRADTVALNHANLAALLPPPARVRDDADPRRDRSLRVAR